ncbi:MAG: histidine--tRNA ligase [Thermodesulfobacteriota bacterium]
MKIKALKGFKDIIPDEVDIYRFIEKISRDIFHRFGFREIRVPVLEKTDLFVRSLGVATDIVEKEMYTFDDRNGDSVTMRPEGTASVLRAYIEQGLHASSSLQKLYTIGPMFRHERPQKGRLRQFHQISVEVLGLDHPRIDAEVMAMAYLLLTSLGLSARLEINSLGCQKCRPGFNQALRLFLDNCQGLCDDCLRRRDTNPLRVLDCKNKSCQEHYQKAPFIIQHLCPECYGHFQTVKEGLKLLRIPYTVNSFMVRGLDYYCRTTFELISDDLGTQNAVGAGGRYDGLVKELGGPDVPGLGFAMGLERLALLLASQDNGSQKAWTDLFIAALGPKAQNVAFPVSHYLREKGLSVTMDVMDRSLKSQMKQADRAGANFVLILGEEEFEKGQAQLRDMRSKNQQPLTIKSDLAEWGDDIRWELGTLNSEF